MRCRLGYNVGLSGLHIYFSFENFLHIDLHVECILRTIFDLCTLSTCMCVLYSLRSCSVEFPHHPAFCAACMHLVNVDYAVLLGGGGSFVQTPGPPHRPAWAVCVVVCFTVDIFTWMSKVLCVSEVAHSALPYPGRAPPSRRTPVTRIRPATQNAG